VGSIVLSSGLRYAALLLLVTGLAGGSPPALAQTSAAAAPSNELEVVVVSARKREESIAEVPTSITAFTAETLKDYNVQSFTDYATKTPNLSFSYGGGPTAFSDARTVAIRGITGQNLLGTAGATGFYIDDTPLPGSIDPRVVDLASIEVLKGPQGTLFGESSLGGNVRLITRQPDLKNSGLGYGADLGITSGGGSADGGANLIANIVLSRDVAALRVVLFGNHDAGYLTRTYPSQPGPPGDGDQFASVPRTSVGDQGAETTYGGSAALLWRATDSLDIRLRLLFQEEKYHGFPATYAPLPGFGPVYTLDRAFNVQPTASDQWTMPTLDFRYSGSGWNVVWANSYFYRQNNDVEDSSYGTQQVLASSFYSVTGLAPQAYLWNGQHWLNQFASEARLSFDPIHGLSGTIGLYYDNVRSRFTIPPTYASGLSNANTTACSLAEVPTGAPCVVTRPAWPNDEIWQQTNPQQQQDKSVFGEVYYRFLQKWTLTVGARQYWLNQSADYTADGFLNGGATPSAPQTNSQSGLNPKFALSVQATDQAMVYGSASKGFRAGGAQPYLTFCSENGLPVNDITHLQSDTLWTYELGTKVQTSNLFISAAAYDIEWNNLQQQVGLPCGYYLQVNGGKARIEGGEFEVNGRLTPQLQFRLGLGYEHTDITEPGPLGSVGVTAGSPVPDVPSLTASVGGVYTQSLGADMQGFVSADYSYTGSSTTLLVGGFGTPTPFANRAGFSLVNLRFGVDRGQSELSLNFRNLLNAKPNLGNIGYIGYAQFDQTGRVIPQVATLQPLTVTLQYTKSL
jgi:outer membrane receptor protein involved in Fe transport